MNTFGTIIGIMLMVCMFCCFFSCCKYCCKNKAKKADDNYQPAEVVINDNGYNNNYNNIDGNQPNYTNAPVYSQNNA